MWLLVVIGPLAVFALTAYFGGDSGPGLSKDFPLQFRVLARLRTPLLMYFVVPLSFALWAYRTIREKIRTYVGTDSTHAQRVEVVAAQLRAWNAAGRKGVLRTARPNWQAMSVKLASNKADACRINTAHLTHILDVDTAAMTLTAEPGVTMGQITAKLVPLGLALQVQVEMESITIGGVSMGFGMETNSHRHGLFQETVVAYELLLSDATPLRVTAQSDADLFYALPWSMGTIAFLTAVTVRLVRIKPYVHMTYIVTRTPAELQRQMHALGTSDSTPDFLEATIYGPHAAVIQCGRLTETVEPGKGRVNGINWWWKPFYFRWVETFIASNGGQEYIPFKHYAHRFTRSIFWELEDMIPFSNHPVYRALWGWMGAPEVSLLKLFQGPVVRAASLYAHVVQESIMPISRIEEGVAKFDEWFGVFPLLVFPIRIYNRGERSGFLTPRPALCEKGKDWGLWVDIGAYGVPRAIRQGHKWDAKKNIRAMEHWTREVGGWQATYTDLFATRAEYRAMFNHALVDKARARFGVTSCFPEPYDKTSSEPGLIDLADEIAAEQAN